MCVYIVRSFPMHVSRIQSSVKFTETSRKARIDESMNRLIKTASRVFLPSRSECNWRHSRTTPSFISSRSPWSTRTTNLSRGHRVIFSPGARSSRRGTGNDHCSLCSSRGTRPSARRAVYTPVTHTYVRAESVRDDSLARGYVCTINTHTLVSSDISPPPLSTTATA